VSTFCLVRAIQGVVAAGHPGRLGMVVSARVTLGDVLDGGLLFAMVAVELANGAAHDAGFGALSGLGIGGLADGLTEKRVLQRISLLGCDEGNAGQEHDAADCRDDRHPGAYYVLVVCEGPQ